MSAANDVGKTVIAETRELFPLPPVFQTVENNLWEWLDSQEPGEQGEVIVVDDSAILQEELDRIFGPDNSEGSEHMAGLILWIRNMEQAAANEAALAAPFEAEAQRHRKRAKSLENRAQWVRDRLALLVEQRGGRFDAGLHKVHVRETPSAQVAGTCKNHGDVLHYQDSKCSAFEVTDQLPATFARVKVEPRLAELRKHLLAEEAAGRPWPAWARVMRRLSAVIR